MNNQEYTEFIEKFEALSPYELNHLCTFIHQHYQAVVKVAQVKNKSITPGDIKEILIQAMQEARVDLAERQVKNAKYNLKMIKSKIYPKKNS